MKTYRTIKALPFINKGHKFTREEGEYEKETNSQYTYIKHIVKDCSFDELVGTWFEKVDVKKEKKLDNIKEGLIGVIDLWEIDDAMEEIRKHI